MQVISSGAKKKEKEQADINLEADTVAPGIW